MTNVRNVRYHISMPPTLRINATTARKNLYNLIDRVGRGTLRVVIHKEGTDNPVILTSAKSIDLASPQDQLQIAADTEGALSGGSYDPNEAKKAKEIFVTEYQKHHDRK